MIKIYIDMNFDDHDTLLNELKRNLLLTSIKWSYERIPKEELRKYTSTVSDVITCENCKLYITHRGFGDNPKSNLECDIFIKLKKTVSNSMLRFYHIIYFKNNGIFDKKTYEFMYFSEIVSFILFMISFCEEQTGPDNLPGNIIEKTLFNYSPLRTIPRI